MLKVFSKKFIVFLAGVILLAGCSGEAEKISGKIESTEEEVPVQVDKTILLFDAESTESWPLVGTLSIKRENEEVQKIASSVLDRHFNYVQNNSSVIYIDKDYKLYRYMETKEPVLMAEHVLGIMNPEYLEEGKLFYMTEDGSIIVDWEGKIVQLPRDVKEYKLLGNKVYLLNERNHLSVLDLNSGQEQPITEDVYTFRFLNEEGDIVFLRSDIGGLYYIAAGQDEVVHIDSNYIDLKSVIKRGNEFYYLQADEEEDTALTVVDLKEKSSPEKLVDEVIQFEISNDTLYYITREMDLYRVVSLKGKSNKITDDAFYMIPFNDRLIIQNVNYDISRWTESTGELELIVKDNMFIRPTETGDIIYPTEDKEIYINHEKLIDHFDQFSYHGGTIVYSLNDRAYFMKNMEEIEQVKIDLADYTSAYYQNMLFYQKEREE